MGFYRVPQLSTKGNLEQETRGAVSGVCVGEQGAKSISGRRTACTKALWWENGPCKRPKGRVRRTRGTWAEVGQAVGR